MFIHHKIRGLILKKVDRGEADQLFTIYTERFGKVKILGKAIRKITSKLRAGIETFYLSDLEFIQSKTYKILTDAVPVKKFKHLTEDLKRFTVAAGISRILDNLVREPEPDERIWNLTLEAFQDLNKEKVKALKVLYYYFFWNFVSLLGYQPELHHCLVCQKKLKPEELYFSRKEGGILCYNCRSPRKTDQKITPDLVKILRLIVNREKETLSNLNLKREHLRSLSWVSKEYSEFIAEHSFADSEY